jgi:DNA-binding response OmpR family regulator
MNSSKRQILLVEDDRGIQGLIAVLFSRKEINVDCAADGEQALLMLRTREYGAVLLDLMLPRVNGFEVMRELKALNPAILKRTIVLTAASDLTLRDFDETQVRKLLRKPFSISDLLMAVDECFTSEGSLSAPTVIPRPSAIEAH